MLSYQHSYHAGNLADVQKHALLCWTLEYLTRKDKPLTYIETHSGRGLYDLAGAEAFLPGWLAGIVQQCVKVDAQEQAALAREFEVFHLPALHLYLDGRYHAPVLCPLAEAAVRTAVGQVIADPAVEAP